MKSLLLISLPGLVLLSTCHNQQPDISSTIIATGEMPNVVTDHSDNIHLVYGSGDSILYSYSLDQGKTFSAPALISIVQKLAASHTRGPQIAATNNGLSVTACNEAGDIFSFVKDQSGRWSQTARVNDSDTAAKENLMALAPTATMLLLHGSICVINIIKFLELSQLMADKHGQRILWSILHLIQQYVNAANHQSQSKEIP
jgi:hypothetical protein